LLLDAKRAQDATISAFLSKAEKHAAGTRDIMESLCDEDAEKHPRPFDADEGPPPPPPPRGRKASAVGRSRAASVRWFKEEQKDNLTSDDGGFADWFHGIISREQATDLLSGQLSGTFLIRVAESRFGYSLSLMGGGSYRHFLAALYLPKSFT
jgi:myosin-3